MIAGLRDPFATATPGMSRPFLHFRCAAKVDFRCEIDRTLGAEARRGLLVLRDLLPVEEAGRTGDPSRLGAKRLLPGAANPSLPRISTRSSILTML